MITLEELKNQLNQIVDDLHLNNAETHADQNGKWFHISITSPDFQGKSEREREHLIWKEFEKRFDDDTILAITQCYLLTPDERSATLGKGV